MDDQVAHEIISQLTPGHQYAMQVLLEKVRRYENALHGIASCATRCGCCEMHQRIATQVLNK